MGKHPRLQGLRPDHPQRARGALRARRPGLDRPAAGARAVPPRRVQVPDPEAGRAWRDHLSRPGSQRPVVLHGRLIREPCRGRGGCRRRAARLRHRLARGHLGSCQSPRSWARWRRRSPASATATHRSSRRTSWRAWTPSRSGRATNEGRDRGPRDPGQEAPAGRRDGRGGDGRPRGRRRRLPQDRRRAGRCLRMRPSSACRIARSRRSSSTCLSRGKHVLVEKPLLAASERVAGPASTSSRVANGAACYTAYNHRFEPHILRLKELLDRGQLGTVYLAQLLLRQRNRPRRPGLELARPGSRRARRPGLAPAGLERLSLRSQRALGAAVGVLTASRTARSITFASASRTGSRRSTSRSRCCRGATASAPTSSASSAAPTSTACASGVGACSPTASGSCRAAGRTRSRTPSSARTQPGSMEYEHFKRLCQRPRDEPRHRHLDQLGTSRRGGKLGVLPQ